ncbi:hypothetical protein L484_023765 [Morus notabilis]|uniref:Amino acid transporter transmembrane domain-containing protein n=1 Tax=Morus notabilis TaxID=981085 RepID=W9RCU8_9ROSA|nr:hypothetical protein L484_023765 [Morus notabilis]
MGIACGKKGTTRTAVAHIIAGVIGSGVLSLSWSVAQLGWIAGPSSMIAFAVVTLVSTNLLSDCYRFPDPQFGHARCPSYAEAVKLYLGEKWQYVSGAFAYESLYGCGIAYTFTSASSISPSGREIDMMNRIIVGLTYSHKAISLGHENSCPAKRSCALTLMIHHRTCDNKDKIKLLQPSPALLCDKSIVTILRSLRK